MTRDMSCSTNRMPMPSAASSARTRPKSWVSVASRPELGSSNNSVLGEVARARATSTRRARPVGSESVGSSATGRMPTRSSWWRASSAGVRPEVSLDRWTSAAICTFSLAVRVPNSSKRWKVRPSPRRERTCGLARVTSWVPRWTRPCVGLCNPVMTLKRVVFPGAVRTDQAVDLAARHLEIDSIERLQAAEAYGDLGDHQQRGSRGPVWTSQPTEGTCPARGDPASPAGGLPVTWSSALRLARRRSHHVPTSE